MPPPDAELTRWVAEEVQPHEPALRAGLQARFPALGGADDVVQEAYARLLRVREQLPALQHRCLIIWSNVR